MARRKNDEYGEYQRDADIFDEGGRKGARERKKKIFETEQISDSIF